ncbi:hypothetical protein G3M48_007013 [Beauveria asiatica]|uniref:Uncharacterized protein n=1 Tax=Beauveria asiatica TaxID=1069075 RepID=A0AAW0S4Q5_9HYPO
MLYTALLVTLGLVSALPSQSLQTPISDSIVPEGRAQAPPGLPFPNITAVKSVPQDSFTSYETGGLKRKTFNTTEESLGKRWACSSQSILTWGDNDDGGRGISITNAGNDWRGFYIFHNSCDGTPWKYIWIEAGKTQFVSIPAGFEGRIQRGVDAQMLNGQPHLLGSWLEFSYDSSDVGWIDVSLIRGCDGAILVWDTTNGDKWKGFTQWILDGAPNGSYDLKDDGQWVIKATEGPNGVVNTIPRDWDQQQVGDQYAYIDDDHAKPVINGYRFGTYWPEGRA